MLDKLVEYYSRRNANLQTSLPTQGFEEKAIPFIIVLNKDGSFNSLQDIRIPQEKGKPIAKNFLVPQSKTRSGAKSYEVANILWDHYGYVLNQPKIEKVDEEPTKKAITDAKNQHQGFKQQIENIANDLPTDAGVQAVKKFLDNPDEIAKVKQDEAYQNCLKIKGCNFAFRLTSENYLCCQSPLIKKWVVDNLSDTENNNQGTCLVTGKQATIARLHPQIQKILGKPFPLASINQKAFESYNKTQGANFPVSETASFEFSTALNFLLNSKQKFRLGDVTVVCWSQKQHQLEHDFATFFSLQDDPSSGVEKVKSLFKSFGSGAKANVTDKQPFYILGLAPNAPARIVVRFWITDTIANISKTIKQWFEDIELIGNDKFGYPSLIKLLRCTVFGGKDDNIAPKLPGEVISSILRNVPLPNTLFANCINRIKAEQCKGKIFYTRCCLLRAYLNKKYRFTNITKGEVTVTLNHEETQIGYILGRLFATLEKLQQDAQGNKLNTTICDNYYSAASCRPKAVFPTLMKLHIHHLKKLENTGFKIKAKRRIGEIICFIKSKQGFPAQLDLEQQGLFAIGYYQQQDDFYTKKDNLIETN
jgi:CRISPR-associated protein Csd1